MNRPSPFEARSCGPVDTGYYPMLKGDDGGNALRATHPGRATPRRRGGLPSRSETKGDAGVGRCPPEVARIRLRLRFGPRRPGHPLWSHWPTSTSPILYTRNGPLPSQSSDFFSAAAALYAKRSRAVEPVFGQIKDTGVLTGSAVGAFRRATASGR